MDMTMANSFAQASGSTQNASYRFDNMVDKSAEYGNSAEVKKFSLDPAAFAQWKDKAVSIWGSVSSKVKDVATTFGNAVAQNPYGAWAIDKFNDFSSRMKEFFGLKEKEQQSQQSGPAMQGSVASAQAGQGSQKYDASDFAFLQGGSSGMQAGMCK